MILHSRTAIMNDYFFIPDGESIKRAVTVGRIYDDLDGLPVYRIADFWAHYLMVPNYLLARDEGRVSSNDWGNNDYKYGYEYIFRTAAETFLNEGVLLKNPEGLYRWVEDGYRLYDVLIETAITQHRIAS